MAKKILIVDDEAVHRTAMIEILKAEPAWSVDAAEDGQAALDLLCDGLRPHVCIIDLLMPKVGGLELAQRIRRDPQLKHLKLVIATASRDRDTILALSKLQVSGFLLKPFTPETTLEKLRPLVGPTEADPTLRSKNLLAHTALVVDSDPESRKSVTDAIRSEEGWEVVEAETAKGALAQLHTGLRPDVAITHLHLSDGPGVDFIRRLRADHELARLKVIALSNAGDRDLLGDLVGLSVAGVLVRPVEPARLRALLGTLRSAA